MVHGAPGTFNCSPVFVVTPLESDTAFWGWMLSKELQVINSHPEQFVWTSLTRISSLTWRPLFQQESVKVEHGHGRSRKSFDSHQPADMGWVSSMTHLEITAFDVDKRITAGHISTGEGLPVPWLQHGTRFCHQSVLRSLPLMVTQNGISATYLPLC